MRQDLAAPHLQVQMLVDHGAAVASSTASHLDHRRPRFAGRRLVAHGGGECRRHQSPTSLKMIANTASARITTVIAVTTEVVVPRRGFRVRLDAQAEVARDERDQHAEHDALAESDPQVRERHRSGSERMKNEKSMLTARISPRRAADQRDRCWSTSPAAASRCRARARFGITSRKPCGMPITCIASSSSVTRITPICAVIADPERPATRIADEHGPELANHATCRGYSRCTVSRRSAQLLRGQIAQHDADQESRRAP